MKNRFDYVINNIFNGYFRDSEDTILFIVKEMYSSMGLEADNQVPQHSMTIERPLQHSPICDGSNQAQMEMDMSVNSTPTSPFKR